MAKKLKNDSEENQEVETAQEELFKLYSLKVREIRVPFLKDGKVEWVPYHVGNWDMTAQETLVAFWQQLKEDNPTFNIEAKMQKLFVLG